MNKKTFALIRAALAVVIAVVILICSGFSFVTLLSSPTQVTDAADLTAGKYVSADITYIMDICAVERDTDGNAVYYYAVAPVGNAFTVIRYPADRYEDITNLENDTFAYLDGTNDSMHFHVVTDGTVTEMPTQVYQYFSDWFNTNASWMSEAGVITAVEDTTQYLCTNMIEADTVHGMSRGTAAILNIIAAVLVLYAIAEVVLVIVGVYNRKKPAQKAKAAAKKPAPKAAPKAEPKAETKAETKAEPKAEPEQEPAAGSGSGYEAAPVKTDEPDVEVEVYEEPAAGSGSGYEFDFSE